MPKPRYEDFAFRGEVNISDTGAMVRERRHFYAPTGAGSDTADQHLAVYLTVPPDAHPGAEPIVRMPAWSDDNGRVEGAYFDAIVASETGRPVLAPNAPGVDFSQWRDPAHDTTHLMTPDQREELVRRGSFRKAGEAIMRALVATSEHFDLPEGYVLHASSMGVALAGGAIAAALGDGVPLRGIVLSEGVNNSERSLPTLGGQFFLQNLHAGGYLAQNPTKITQEGEAPQPIIPGETMGHWLQRTREAWPANKLYVRALARAGFLGDLGDVSGLGEQRTPVLLTRGTASRLATVEGHQKVYEHFKQSYVPTENHQYDGHDHPYTMTVQSVIDAVEAVA